MKRLITLATVVAGVLSILPTARAATPTTVPASAVFPESIAAEPGTTSFFVSSFLTGSVVKGRLGEQAQPFLPAGSDGRTSASGLRVDAHGRLFVLTGTGQRLQIFNARNGRRLADFAAPRRPGSNLNDIAFTKQGDVYITDFGTPGIYRVSARQLAARAGRISLWLSPREQVVPDLPSGGNLNGIAATPDGRYLLVDQTGNGALYRIDIAKRSVRRIDVSGGSLVGCDGVLLRNRTLYVTTHANAVAKLRLNGNFTHADIVRRVTAPTLNFPTSIEQLGNKVVITNALKAASAPEYQLTVLPVPFG